MTGSPSAWICEFHSAGPRRCKPAALAIRRLSD